MPSQRNDLGQDNVHNSKNTRIDFSRQSYNMDYRKDEIMHIGRYWNGVKTMMGLSSKLKRPIRVLDIGCGEMNTAKMFNSSVVVKKSSVIEKYIHWC